MSNRTITEEQLRDKLEFYQERLNARYVGNNLKMKWLAKVQLLQELINEL